MILVLADPARNINNAVEEMHNRKRVTLLVELDNMKFELQGYESPLAEVRDSL